MADDRFQRQPNWVNKISQKIIKQSLILLLVIGILSNAVFARENSPCVRPEAKIFLPLIGDWKVQWTNRVQIGKYETISATLQIERDAVGCTLIEHFSADNKKFSAISLIRVGNKDELQRVLLDFGHGQSLTFKGAQDGEIIRFQWEKNLGERILMLKHEYQKIQANSFETTIWLCGDSGKTWDIVQKAVYERRTKS